MLVWSVLVSTPDEPWTYRKPWELSYEQLSMDEALERLQAMRATGVQDRNFNAQRETETLAPNPRYL